MLKRLQAYFSRKPVAGLDELADHLDVAPSALRGMLDVLISKGRVRLICATGACGGCKGCAFNRSSILYVWQGRRAPLNHSMGGA